MTDSERAAMLSNEALMRAALVTLLARAGGQASYTEEEYQAVAASYGGTARLAIHVDVIRAEASKPEVRLSLIRKDPANAELVS